ncbi:hypothetical protein AB0L53_14285 [Nonomuraea sp. NPDC052129]|uniref:hypothetical protein n=1 Tax=Nonomuraea sp. NPDC052129 TaxID=3154651 RepID=UPI0034158828
MAPYSVAARPRPTERLLSARSGVLGGSRTTQRSRLRTARTRAPQTVWVSASAAREEREREYGRRQALSARRDPFGERWGGGDRRERSGGRDDWGAIGASESESVTIAGRRAARARARKTVSARAPGGGVASIVGVMISLLRVTAS